ncbi:hypothetical protein PDQ79_28705 [Bacillus cereus]|nr:hypothetical protein [Bacillus cereus]
MNEQKKQKLLQDMYEKFIYTMRVVCPNSREKVIAITNVETAYFWAQKSLEENKSKINKGRLKGRTEWLTTV